MKELVKFKIYLPDDFEESKLSKGSTNNYGRGRSVDVHAKYHKRLAKIVKDIIRTQYPDLRPVIASCYVNLKLVVQHEPNHFTKVRFNKTKNFRYYSIKSPDIDKAKRCIQDTLEGLVYKNDSMVSGGSEWKFYSLDKTHIVIESGIVEQTENDLKEQEKFWRELDQYGGTVELMKKAKKKEKKNDQSNKVGESRGLAKHKVKRNRRKRRVRNTRNKPVANSCTGLAGENQPRCAAGRGE